MKEEDKALQVAGKNQLAESSQPNMLQIAIEKGVTGEELSKLMDLYERNEKNEARKAYHVAMANFKANPPKLNKDAHVRYETSKGVTEYTHATLANITDKISQRLSEEGLSATWKTGQSEKGAIIVTCRITHVLGHYEDTPLEAPADGSGGKNSIQAIGSTVTYLQRYTLLASVGLATADMDDDGRGSEGEEKFITEGQQKKIADMIGKAGADYKLFLKYLKIDKIEELQASRFESAMKNLKQKERVQNEGAKK